MISRLTSQKSTSHILISLLLLTLSCSLNAQHQPTHSFIENKGQILNQDYLSNKEVLYMYAGKGIKVQLRKNGYSYELSHLNNSPAIVASMSNVDRLDQLTKICIQNYRVDIDFVQMNDKCTVIADNNDKSPGYLNYYVCGHDAQTISSFTKITYKNIYKNTDIEFIIRENEENPLKYNIILHPGADLNAVKFLIKGASLLSMDNKSLLIETPMGTIHEKIPYSYYTDTPGTNEEVSFMLDENTLSFKANYNTSKTMIIDPSSNLIWSTYYSGEYIDYCKSTRVDSQNNVYIAGYTSSTSYIATNNSFQSTLIGNLDGYLAKFDPDGQRLWATYFGGSNMEQILAMHISSDDYIYLAGDVTSTSGIVTPGMHQMTYGGGADDMLLVKFNTSGQRVWATYFGGLEHEFAQAVCTDNEGNVFIAGHTTSGNAMATPGAYRTTYNFSEDACIAKFTSNGALLWGTYYNDSGEEIVHSLACDTDGNVYATGITTSIAGIATNGSHQSAIGGMVGSDGFLAKFNPYGNTLLWATYYGGANNDEGTSVRVGQNGLVYLLGNTSSNASIATPNSYQSTIGSAEDVFLACFDQAGVRQWATYFGGNGTDYGSDLAIDAGGSLIFCGQTLSSNAISTPGAHQNTISTPNNYDAYFAKFSSTGQFKLGSYFGAYNNDVGKSITVDPSGKIYMAGETTSTVGIATALAHQTLALGSGDCFLSKFYVDTELSVSQLGNDASDALKLYPVPSSDYLTLTLRNQLSTAKRLEIYSITGQLVSVVDKPALDHVVDVRHLNAGIYILHASIEDKDYYSRFIKE